MPPLTRKELAVGQPVMVLQHRRPDAEGTVLRVGRSLVEIEVGGTLWKSASRYYISSQRLQGSFGGDDRFMTMDEYARRGERADALVQLARYEVEVKWQAAESWSTQQLVDLVAALKSIRGA